MDSDCTSSNNCKKNIRKANVNSEDLKTILKMKITMLALSDRGDHPIDPEDSMDILKTMRDRYASSVSDEELLQLYQEVLRRDA